MFGYFQSSSELLDFLGTGVAGGRARHLCCLESVGGSVGDLRCWTLRMLRVLFRVMPLFSCRRVWYLAGKMPVPVSHQDSRSEEPAQLGLDL